MHETSRVFVAGHRGLVGSAIIRRLNEAGQRGLPVATREQLDLRDQAAVNYWFRANRPDFVIWGTGTPKSGFVPVDDLADACLFLMEHYDQESHINIGTGEDLTIAELAALVRDIVHPAALIAFDTSKPDGSPRKLLHVSRLHRLGWTHKFDLRAGVQDTYRWFLEHKSEARLEPAQAVSLGSANG